MSGAQIAALLFAILLLFPGGCFLLLGISLASDRQFSDAAPVALAVAFGILGLVGLLGWFAFRKKRPPATRDPA